MITITDTLACEHVLLCSLFDEIDQLLRHARTLNEVRMLAQLVERVLSRHAESEENLAYVALDHVLADRGQLDQLHQDHHEIDDRLHAVARATHFSGAVRLLNASLEASRAHFRREELHIFPLFNQLFNSDSLEALGSGVVIRRAGMASGS